MDIRSAAITFAVGVAVGIVTAWASGDPILTSLVLLASLLVILIGAIGAYRQKQWRRAGAAAMDARYEAGNLLRNRLAGEDTGLSDEADQEYWLEQLREWDGPTVAVIKRYKSSFYQKYVTWPVAPGLHPGMKIYRSRYLGLLDANLQALADLRTHF